MSDMKRAVLALCSVVVMGCGGAGGGGGQDEDLPSGCGDQLSYQESHDYSALARVLNDDVLRLDMSQGRDDCGYLGLEAGIAGSCGGRWLQDDVVDATYSMLITGETYGVQDGIIQNDISFSLSFPYLPGPQE